MIGDSDRFESVRRSMRLSVIIALAVAVLGVIIGFALFQSDEAFLTPQKIIGIGAVLVAGALAAFAIATSGFVGILLKIEANSWQSEGTLHDVQRTLERQERVLETIAENVQLSEVARSLGHRKAERNALRKAINEEIARGDWEAAYALVEQLESRHGYRNEAARLRAELDASRNLEQDHRVHDAVELVKSRMAAHDWDRARQEMDKLFAAHPGHAEVEELPALFARMRDEHKRRLLKTWDEAIQRNEIDKGIEVLRELDQYLTPNEAAALEESARGVFRAKLHNLGVQFSLAVTDGLWQRALQIGRQIVQEFPNTRMAEEVRERMHTLQKRAVTAPEAAPQADAAPA